MSKRIINCGEVYWVDPSPTVGKEIKGNHRFIVITKKEFNQLGVVMTVPVTRGGSFARAMGICVPISGHDTVGVALCNQMRSFDIEARTKAGSAKYIERLEQSIIEDIIDRVISLIDPEEL
jgi:mRNA interferase ChpB